MIFFCRISKENHIIACEHFFRVLAELFLIFAKRLKLMALRELLSIVYVLLLCCQIEGISIMVI